LYLNDDIPAREGMAEIEPRELVKACNYFTELLAHVPDGLSRAGHWRYLQDGLLAKFAPPVAVRTVAFMLALRDHCRKPQALTDDQKIIAYLRAASAPLDPQTLNSSTRHQSSRTSGSQANRSAMIRVTNSAAFAVRPSDFAFFGAFSNLEFCGKRKSAGGRSLGGRCPRISNTPPHPL
jgi:hypothetical protein